MVVYLIYAILMLTCAALVLHILEKRQTVGRGSTVLIPAQPVEVPSVPSPPLPISEPSLTRPEPSLTRLEPSLTRLEPKARPAFSEEALENLDVEEALKAAEAVAQTSVKLPKKDDTALEPPPETAEVEIRIKKKRGPKAAKKPVKSGKGEK